MNDWHFKWRPLRSGYRLFINDYDHLMFPRWNVVWYLYSEGAICRNSGGLLNSSHPLTSSLLTVACFYMV